MFKFFYYVYIPVYVVGIGIILFTVLCGDGLKGFTRGCNSYLHSVFHRQTYVMIYIKLLGEIYFVSTV